MKVPFLRAAKLMAAAVLLTGVFVPTAAGAFNPYAPTDRAVINDPGRLVTTKNSLKIELTFTSNFADSTYGCSLEKGPNLGGYNKKPLQPCSSPATYTVKLPPLHGKKKHSTTLLFWVRASSPSAGYPLPDPQYRGVTITRKAKPKVCGGSSGKPMRCPGPK